MGETTTISNDWTISKTGKLNALMCQRAIMSRMYEPMNKLHLVSGSGVFNAGFLHLLQGPNSGGCKFGSKETNRNTQVEYAQLDLRSQFKRMKSKIKHATVKETKPSAQNHPICCNNTFSVNFPREYEIILKYAGASVVEGVLDGGDVVNICNELSNLNISRVPLIPETPMRVTQNNLENPDINDCDGGATNVKDPCVVTLRRPAWLPSDWKPGDALPKKPVEELPEWQELGKVLSSESMSRLSTFLDKLGDNGRNQMARPVEYLAQAKAIDSKISSFFDSAGLMRDVQGAPIQITTQGTTRPCNRLRWSRCTHPEIEFYYDRRPKACTFVTVFYMSFFGKGIPQKADWVDAAKAEMLNVDFQEVKETRFYVVDSSTKNPYPPEKVIVDPLVIKYFATSASHEATLANDDDGDGGVSYALRIGDDNASYLLREDLTGTTFWNSYLCNMRNNGSHATLSDKENYAVGNPEMLKTEAAEKPMQGLGDNVLSDTYRNKINEMDSRSYLRLPRLSTISRLCAPDSEVIYLNGLVFRRNNQKLLRSVYPRDDPRREVGFDTILEDIKTYRVIIRTGVIPFHFRDHDSTPEPYPDEAQFDEYLSNLKHYCIKTKQEGRIPDVEITQLPVVTRPPLMSQDEWEYSNLVGIRIPETVIKLNQEDLAGLILKKRKENEFATPEPAASKRRKLQSEDVTPATGKSSLLNYFQTTTATTTKTMSTATTVTMTTTTSPKTPTRRGTKFGTKATVRK